MAARDADAAADADWLAANGLEGDLQAGLGMWSPVGGLQRLQRMQRGGILPPQSVKPERTQPRAVGTRPAAVQVAGIGSAGPASVEQGCWGPAGGAGAAPPLGSPSNPLPTRVQACLPPLTGDEERVIFGVADAESPGVCAECRPVVIGALGAKSSVRLDTVGAPARRFPPK